LQFAVRGCRVVSKVSKHSVRDERLKVLEVDEPALAVRAQHLLDIVLAVCGAVDGLQDVVPADVAVAVAVENREGERPAASVLARLLRRDGAREELEVVEVARERFRSMSWNIFSTRAGGISGCMPIASLNSCSEMVPLSSVSIFTKATRSSSSLAGGVEKAIDSSASLPNESWLAQKASAAATISPWRASS